MIQPENVADVMTRVSDSYDASHEERLRYTFGRTRVCGRATVLLFNRGNKITCRTMAWEKVQGDIELLDEARTYPKADMCLMCRRCHRGGCLTFE